MATSQTLTPTNDQVGVNVFKFEHEMFITSDWRASIRADHIPKVQQLKTLFGQIELLNVHAEIRQHGLVGDELGNIASNGHIFLALIPTARNTDARAGTSATVVSGVPNKQTFPLTGEGQSVKVFNFDLQGYETDLAQDPRRGQGVVLWVGNSGVSIRDSKSSPANGVICSVTWRAEVRCSGSSNLW